MARDKAKDDKMFNCAQQHEQDYVVGLYSWWNQAAVRKFLIDGCNSNLIKNCTHQQLYALIKKNLLLEIPI